MHEADSKLIDALGGPAAVADLLGYRKPKGTSRVHNWKTRGIPASVKVARPDLFMPEVIGSARMPAEQEAR